MAVIDSDEGPDPAQALTDSQDASVARPGKFETASSKICETESASEEKLVPLVPVPTPVFVPQVVQAEEMSAEPSLIPGAD